MDVAALIFCTAALGVAVLYPTVRLLVRAAWEWQPQAIVAGDGWTAVVNTLVMSFASVACSGVAGTALAVLLTQYDFPGRATLGGLAYLPLTLPPLVGVLAFYFLIGRDGILPMAMERWFGLADWAPRGPIAILLIHTYSFYVFFYSMASSALSGLDPSLIEAARTLGASRFHAFRRVTLPLLRPALVGAALLTFMTSGASFSAPLIFGNDYPMLSVRIYEEMSKYNEAGALTLTVLLAGVSLLGVLLFRTRRTGGGGSKGVRRAVRSRAGRWAAGAFSAASIVVLLTPHLAIVWLSFVDHQAWTTELIPTTFTWDNYVEIFQNPRAFAPIRNSLWMSATAAAATLLVGVPAGYLIGRRRPGGRWVNLAVMIPWALPGTVVAMNLIVAFNDPWLSRSVLAFILPTAYFVRNIPLLTRMAAASIASFDATLIEAGRTLGATPLRCLVVIAGPLIAPGLIAATALVFALSLGEFVASILLYRPNTLPIAVQINMQLRGSGIGSGFAYSVLLLILVTVTFVAARRFSSRVI